MAPFSSSYAAAATGEVIVVSAKLILLFFGGVVSCTTFTFVNECGSTVWPGFLSNSGSPDLGTTGLALAAGESYSLSPPAKWSGRFWARTGCNFDKSGHGTCSTGDCGSGQIQCNGAGAAPPATLIEFALDGSGGMDFYDVSLVDGYNLAVVVEPKGGGGAGNCSTTGCMTDLNARCPKELKTDDGAGCRSACEAFGTPEYCCSGSFSNPNTCRPTAYSEMFKSACPRSYSYAYDDPTSTFTCVGADYVVTFCPASSPSSTTPSKKSGRISQRPSDEQLENEAWLATLVDRNGGSSAVIGVTTTWLFLQALLHSGFLSLPLLQLWS